MRVSHQSEDTATPKQCRHQMPKMTAITSKAWVRDPVDVNLMSGVQGTTQTTTPSQATDREVQWKRGTKRSALTVRLGKRAHHDSEEEAV